jgi:hypothetical protein
MPAKSAGETRGSRASLNSIVRPIMSNSKASVIVLSATAIHVVGIASAIYFHETNYDYLSMLGGFFSSFPFLSL